MKRITLCFSFTLALLLLAGCSSEKPAATPTLEPPTPTATAEAVVLELIGASQTQSLTMAELKALPVAEGWGGGKSSTGRITPPELHKGVALQELCALIGGLQSGQGVSLVAKDGYAMTYSYDQVMNSEFITYDPGTGDEITIDDPLQVIIAYERSGQPIPEDEDGPLRLAIVSPQNNQVVDGHWTVKWVAKVEIKDMAEDWILPLDGAISEEMDRATFESCAAANCHQATWTDPDGQVWTGVPLWLLAGRIDGGDRHGDEAYNRVLAQQGYALEVIAADGYSASFDSTRFDQNDAILLAYLLNGEVLAEEQFPLRLVGADLSKSEMVGQVARIAGDLPAEAAVTPAPTIEPPSEPWTLQLQGAETEQVDWAAFDSCAKCHQATWTDDEGQLWTGVPLWRLAGRVDDTNRHDAGAYNQALADAGYSLEVIAADGYAVSFDSGRISRDDTVLLADRVNGAWLEEKHFPLRLVGAGLQKSEMVGQVATISLSVPAEDVETPASEGAGETALVITGAVQQEQALSMQALQGMEIVEISVEHPKKGPQGYKGVRLNALLDLAGVDPVAARVVMIASDGYETYTSLEQVRACADCMVAFTDTGTLDMVMPDLESGLWVKDVIKIELQ